MNLTNIVVVSTIGIGALNIAVGVFGRRDAGISVLQVLFGLILIFGILGMRQVP